MQEWHNLEGFKEYLAHSLDQAFRGSDLMTGRDYSPPIDTFHNPTELRQTVLAMEE